MMNRFRKISCRVVCILLLATFTAKAQDETKIADLEWMVGDWRAVEKSAGVETVLHLSVRESDNHQSILYRAWIESKGRHIPKYNGMYYWHPRENTYKLFQVDSDGSVAEGTYEQIGNRVVQVMKTTSEKTEMESRSEWEIRPREFHFVGAVRPAGKTEWKPSVDLTYSRMPAD